ncbi:MAG: hypothetical protein ACTHOE_08925 [Conexibacter sp.]
MSRIRTAVVSAALLVALAAVPAAAHEGDPNYRSVVDKIAPATGGLSGTVLDHDDALQLVNKSGKDVVVLDEDGKPYARLLADGTVQVNARSSLARGENAPSGASAGTASGSAWVTVDRTGRYAWHDPRINYRVRAVPPQVTDTSKQTKVKDWRVPLLVAGRTGGVAGTLTWVGEPGAGSSFPTAAVVSLVVLVLLALGAVVLVRRRRADEAGVS